MDPRVRSQRAADLMTADTVAVTAGEHRLAVTAVEETAGQWETVIYLDRVLTGPAALRNAAEELAGLAPALVKLGPVRVVVGGDEVSVALPATTDPEIVSQALRWMRVRETGEDRQLAARKDFIEEFRLQDAAAESHPSLSATAGKRIADLAAGVRAAVSREVRIIDGQRRALLGWAAENRAAGPRLLLLVSGGADEQPLEYYQALLERVGIPEATDGLVDAGTERTAPELAKTLSVLGWTTIPCVWSGPDELTTGSLEGEIEGDDRVETVIRDGQEVEQTLLKPTLDPRDLFRRKEGAAAVEAKLLRPLEGLTALAEETGGALVKEGDGLDDLLAELGTWQYLRVAGELAEFEPSTLEVRRIDGDGELGAALPSRRWLGFATQDQIATLRLRNLLAESDGEGELPISAQLATSPDGQQLTVRVEPEGGLAATLPPGGHWRVSAATFDGEDELRVAHILVDGAEGADEVEGALELNVNLDLVVGSGAPLAVAVEQLEEKVWGATYASVAYAGADENFLGLIPSAKTIHLMQPEGSVVYGDTLFETIYNDNVKQVDFYLDGRIVASQQLPPFSATLELGELPEPHRVTAVALDGSGGELGRDELSINGGIGSFRAHLIRPRALDFPLGSSPITGPVDVEARIDLPKGNELERVEFYWGERLVATRFAPPFTQRIVIPEEQPKGFFRVVGYLSDGEIAEDVLFVNNPAGADRLDIELVELYTVVTDRDGRPRRGLRQDLFRVYEDGAEQEIATFSEAHDQPLTIGLAIDSSASMFVKLPQVQKAAADFIAGLDSEKDRAFVVDFGSEPSLFQDLSGNLEAVGSSLQRLRPEGQTAIWKGIVYSLVQLQGIAAKRALIVYSDGADEDPEFDYRLCLRFARRVGVPVYIILANNEIYRTQGKGLTVRAFMNRMRSLTRAVGGRVFLTRVGDDLQSIYREIEEELRSQYVLGYYADGRREDRWHTVRVEVEQRGARARTVAGYFR